MTEPSLNLGNGNWAGKSGNLLAYHKSNNNFYADDLTFARASSGTRVNSSGLIETAQIVSTTEEVTNGDFATNSDWTIESTWTISGGAANGNGANGSTQELKQTSVNTIGKIYKATFEVLNYVSGTVGFWQGSGISVIPRSANGTYTEYFTATSTEIRFRGTNFYGSIDNVSVKEVIENDIPRVDYLNNSNGSLILEPQRTNLVTYSSDYTVTTALTRITVSSDYGTSPSGLSDSTAIFNTAANGRHNIGGLYFSVTSGTTYANSVFAKAGTLSKINLRMFSGGGTLIGFNDGTFDLINGTATGTGAIIEDYGNGWYRCIVVDSPTSSVSNARFNIELLDNNGSVSYLGSTDEYIEIYGSQVEAGSYPTSLINTTGTAVTRLADACYILNNTDVIGQEEGVVFIDLVFTGIIETYSVFKLSQNGSNLNRLQLYFQDTRLIVLSASTSGGFIVQIIENPTTIGKRYKVAIQYKDLDFKVYLNGTQVYTNTTAYSPDGMNQVTFSSGGTGTQYGFYNDIKQLLLYKEILTNDELATLTTL